MWSAKRQSWSVNHNSLIWTLTSVSALVNRENLNFASQTFFVASIWIYKAFIIKPYSTSAGLFEKYSTLNKLNKKYLEPCQTSLMKVFCKNS